MTSDENTLQIYLAQDSIGATRSNIELVEKLSSFCGFDKSNEDGIDRKYLLLYILTEDDQAYIDAQLDKDRVPPLISDNELIEEAERHKREQGQPRALSSATKSIQTDSKESSSSKYNEKASSSTGSKLAALADRLLTKNIRVYTVRNGGLPDGRNHDAFVYDRKYPSTSSLGAGEPYFVDPKKRSTFGLLPNVRAMSMRRSEDPESERLAALGETYVSVPTW